MTDTPDLFQNLAGQLVPANTLSASDRDRTVQYAAVLDAGNPKDLGETGSHLKQATVPTQNALPMRSTNFSSSAESRRAGVPPTAQSRADMDRSGIARPGKVDSIGFLKPQPSEASGGSVPPTENYFGDGGLAASGSVQNHSGTESHSAAIGHVRGNDQGHCARARFNSSLPDRSLVAAVAAPSVHSRNEQQGTPLFPKDQGDPLISPSKQQLIRTREAMRDGQWRSLSEISKVTGDPEASVSARLRDLRKARYGLWTVRRKRVGSLFLYQLGGKGI